MLSDEGMLKLNRLCQSVFIMNLVVLRQFLIDAGVVAQSWIFSNKQGCILYLQFIVC